MIAAKEPRPESRVLMGAAHYSFPWVFAVMVVLGVATALTGNRIPLLRWTVVVGGTVWAGFYTQLTDYHDRHLCERCAGEIPLNAQEQASRKRRLLRWHHMALPAMAVIIAIVAALLLSHLLPRPLHWVHWVIDAAGLAAAAGFYYTEKTHRLLQPWCPWCRWRGEGDHEEVPEPDTDPAVSA